MENKRASSPLHEMKKAKLRKLSEVDSNKSQQPSGSKPQESPFVWSFYENPEETYLVGSEPCFKKTKYG